MGQRRAGPQLCPLKWVCPPHRGAQDPRQGSGSKHSRKGAAAALPPGLPPTLGLTPRGSCWGPGSGLAGAISKWPGVWELSLFPSTRSGQPGGGVAFSGHVARTPAPGDHVGVGGEESVCTHTSGPGLGASQLQEMGLCRAAPVLPVPGGPVRGWAGRGGWRPGTRGPAERVCGASGERGGVKRALLLPQGLGSGFRHPVPLPVQDHSAGGEASEPMEAGPRADARHQKHSSVTGGEDGPGSTRVASRALSCTRRRSRAPRGERAGEGDKQAKLLFLFKSGIYKQERIH